MAVGTRDRHLTRFEWLPQGFEGAAPEFAEFVQEEHSAMGKRDLPRSGRIAAADQPRRRDGVVRSTKGSLGPQRPRPTGPGNPGDLEDLFTGHRRQNGRHATGGKRLAGTGWADHQQTVTTGGSNLDRVPQARLAAQVFQVRKGRTLPDRTRHSHTARKRPARQAAEFCDALDGPDLDPRSHRRLRTVGLRQDDSPAGTRSRHLGHRQCPAHRPDRTVQGQFSSQRPAGELLTGNLACGGEQRGCQGQVQPGTCLAYLGRGEVGGDSAHREFEAGVDQGGTDPLARLAYGRIGQTDDLETRQAAVDVNLDPNRTGRDRLEGERCCFGEHTVKVGGLRSPVARQLQQVANRTATKPGHLPGRPVHGTYSGSMDARSKDSRRETGQAAERLCEGELRQRGWSILDRNWRIRLGEIDLVARDGRTLVIVEVKSSRPGRGAGPVTPVLAVDRRKQQRLRRLATAWLVARQSHVSFDEIRFDVVGVTFAADGSVAAWEHIEGAY